jgi:hypothetical protein
MYVYSIYKYMVVVYTCIYSVYIYSNYIQIYNSMVEWFRVLGLGDSSWIKIFRFWEGEIQIGV